jgi:APA family basic amino acid/polyamine antiporter
MAAPNNSAGADARQLGLWSATALVVGHTIGVGVFLTPATLIGSLGSPLLILGVWVVCGAAVFAGALTFGELAARFPRAGGLYVYLREAWGPQVAFLYGWQSLLVMDPGVTAALAAGVSGYLAGAWPGAGDSRWIAAGVIWTLALLNMGGVRLSASVLNALTGVKVLSLVFVIGLAFFAVGGSWTHFVPFSTRGNATAPINEALALGLVAAFFSFGGFWEASRVAGEVRDPNRTLPRALGLGVAAITAVYLMTTVAFLYLVPAEAATNAAEFTQRAGFALAGSAGPQWLAAVVLLSVVASLAALLMLAPRLYVAMARDAVLPRFIAPRDRSRDTSPAGTVLLAGLATLYSFLGSFQQIVAFFFCTALAFVALSACGVFVLRRRPSSGDAAGFRCPGYPFVPGSFVLLLVTVVSMVAAARPVQALSGVAIVLIGLPVYRLLRARGALARHVPQGVES